MRTQALVLGIALIAMSATAATAERLVRNVSNVSSTSDARGGSRIVFHWDASLSEGPVAVRQALLKFELAGEVQEKSITLRIYPVTSDGGQVSFNEEVWSHSEIDLSRSGTAVVDVTNLVKEIAESGLTSYGFLLVTDAHSEQGLSTEDLGRFAGLSEGSIEVVWRKVPALPRSQQES